jgi:hypothetical protein
MVSGFLLMPLTHGSIPQGMLFFRNVTLVLLLQSCDSRNNLFATLLSLCMARRAKLLAFPVSAKR